MSAYEGYMEKVDLARATGYTDRAIIQELLREKESIIPRSIVKQATLAVDRNPYKKREAARSAMECIKAIDRICQELAPKEIPV